MCLPSGGGGTSTGWGVTAGAGTAAQTSGGLFSNLTMGQAAVGVQAIGAVTSVIGSYYAAKGQKAALQAQADAARTNAAIAELNADTTLKVSGYNADLAESLALFNSDMSLAIGDINVGLATALMGLNDNIADGNYDLIIGRGEVAAAVAEGNARIAEANAQDALRAGQQQEQQSRLKYAALKGQQRARLAANGLALDEGSSLRILTDTDYLSDVDADTLHANAVRAAMGYRTQAAGYLNEADAARLSARAEGLTAKAEALGASLGMQTEILNMRLNSQFSALQTRVAGAVEGYNLRQQGRTQAANERLQGLGYRNAATAASATAGGISPFGAAANTLLSQGGQVAASWYALNKKGAV